MIRLMAFAAMIFAAGPAMALSCIRPDPLRMFRQLSADPDAYYVLSGRLTFDESLLPQSATHGGNSPVAVPAQFDGHALSEAGFVTPYAGPVTLQPVCYGPWCGGATSGEAALMFARVAGGTLVIKADPCGAMIFAAPDLALQAALAACMRRQECGATP